MPRLAPLHRWLGLLACLAVFSFALSGLMHPVMSRLQPQPVQRDAPPVVLPQPALAPVAVLRRQHIDQLTHLRLVQVDSDSAYRVETGAGPARYFASTDGRELAQGEARHAETLARHASGDHHSAVSDLSLVTAFDGDYPEVNRLLPVWRVRLDRADGLTAYVDTRHNRLSTLQDDPKRLVQGLFLQLHNFAALDGLPWLRLPLMLLLLTAALTTTATGLLLFMRRRRAARRWRLSTRDYHRNLALAISVTTFSFAISGGWHLLHGQSLPAPPADATFHFASSELGDWSPAAAFHLSRVAGTACYRVPHGQPAASHAHHGGADAGDHRVPSLADCLDTATGAPLAHAEQLLAEALARHHSNTGAGVPLASLRPVLQFEDDYGFANKRLPVWQARFAGDGTRWYVETASGALALRADGGSHLEGWLFSNLHKWQFIPQRDLRDGLQVLFASAHLLVAGLGIRLFLGCFRRGRTSRAALAASAPNR